jgi:predicted DNA binding CopG/RHH family protein
VIEVRDDVLAAIKREAKKQGLTIKEYVMKALGRGSDQ